VIHGSESKGVSLPPKLEVCYTMITTSPAFLMIQEGVQGSVPSVYIWESEPSTN